MSSENEKFWMQSFSPHIGTDKHLQRPCANHLPQPQPCSQRQPVVQTTLCFTCNQQIQTSWNQMKRHRKRAWGRLPCKGWKNKKQIEKILLNELRRVFFCLCTYFRDGKRYWLILLPQSLNDLKLLPPKHVGTRFTNGDFHYLTVNLLRSLTSPTSPSHLF